MIGIPNNEVTELIGRLRVDHGIEEIKSHKTATTAPNTIEPNNKYLWLVILSTNRNKLGIAMPIKAIGPQ